jgi:hypothetical protein
MAVGVAAVLTTVVARPADAAAGNAHFFMAHREFSPGPADVILRTKGGFFFAPRVNVTNQAGEIRDSPIEVSAVQVGSQLHLLVATGHALLHTIRREDRTWPPFTRIDTSAAGSGPTMDLVAANVGGSLHVVIRTLGGGIFHAARSPSGAWTGFGDVEGEAGQIRNFTTFITDVAGAGFVNGELQVVAATNRTYLHTIRRADGSWTPWSDVIRQTGNPGRSFSSLDITAAAVGNDLHLIANNSSIPFHAVRHGDGSWTRFANVFGQTGDPGSVVSMIAATGYAGNGELLLAVKTIANSTHPARTMYTQRAADGSWMAFNGFPAPTPASAVQSLAVAGE